MAYDKIITKELEKIKLNEKVIVGDPCYELRFVSKVKNVLPGVYHTFIRIADCDSWGKRVSRVMAIHEKYLHKIDYQDDSPYALENSHYGLYCLSAYDTIGVDSGQAGIYDYDYFCENEADRDYNNENGWYRRVCNMTLANKGGNLDARCVVSDSGYGDGSYRTILFQTKDTMKMVAFVIDFDIEYAEDDEWFDDDDEELEEEMEED